MKYLSLLIKPVSGACNMDCSYCFYKELVSNENERIVMSDEVCDVLLEHAFSAGGEEILFAFQGGEPLLAGIHFYRKFIEKVNRRKGGQRISYSIQTNGLLLDDAYAALFRENNFLVGISLDGPKYVHDACRVDYQGRGTFYKVLENAKRLMKAGVQVNILTVVTSKLAANPGRAYEFYKKHGFGFLQFIPCMDSIYSVQGGEADSLKNDQYLNFLREWFMRWREDLMTGNYVSIRHFDNWVRICMGLAVDTCALSGQCGSYFVIERNGSVYPCDFYVHDTYRLGNVQEDNFEILLGRLTESGFLTSCQSRRSGECETCRNRDLCRGGCKRDWIMTENGGKTRYCEALNIFFDEVRGELIKIARCLTKN